MEFAEFSRSIAICTQKMFLQSAEACVGWSTLPLQKNLVENWNFHRPYKSFSMVFSIFEVLRKGVGSLGSSFACKQCPKLSAKTYLLTDWNYSDLLALIFVILSMVIFVSLITRLVTVKKLVPPKYRLYALTDIIHFTRPTLIDKVVDSFCLHSVNRTKRKSSFLVECDSLVHLCNIHSHNNDFTRGQRTTESLHEKRGFRKSGSTLKWFGKQLLNILLLTSLATEAAGLPAVIRIGEKDNHIQLPKFR